jgi:hypothetical protein
MQPIACNIIARACVCAEIGSAAQIMIYLARWDVCEIFLVWSAGVKKWVAFLIARLPMRFIWFKSSGWRIVFYSHVLQSGNWCAKLWTLVRLQALTIVEVGIFSRLRRTSLCKLTLTSLWISRGWNANKRDTKTYR